MKYTSTATEISVHLVTEHPLYGESATRVRLADEGAGCFIEIEQGQGKIAVDPEEFELIVQEVSTLLGQASVKEASDDSP